MYTYISLFSYSTNSYIHFSDIYTLLHAHMCTFGIYTLSYVHNIVHIYTFVHQFSYTYTYLRIHFHWMYTIEPTFYIFCTFSYNYALTYVPMIIFLPLHAYIYKYIRIFTHTSSHVHNIAHIYILTRTFSYISAHMCTFCTHFLIFIHLALVHLPL